ncbi:MAG: 2-phospho-L-lactate guanylyltransferase [Chloroflexi bacterium]|nr:2-phospho-L-lactate guanylyltransferase [Chloroflexota bacterium]
MIVGVVPIKRLSESKSRLSPVLSPPARASLTLALLERTVDAMRSSRGLGRLALVGPEPELAVRLGVEALRDPGDLNGALMVAVGWALRSGAAGLLIVPGDLPGIGRRDIDDLVGSAPGAPSVTTVGTYDGGTGALLLMPPDVIPPAFGPDSFARHLSLAGSRGIAISAPPIAGFARDLDTVEDLHSLDPSIWPGTQVGAAE